jgi:hypothetical protein
MCINLGYVWANYFAVFREVIRKNTIINYKEESKQFKNIRIW